MESGPVSRDLTWDLVWTNGGVQQVWGLGIPFWRLPFESLARLLGRQAFPDRFAFGIALTLIIYAVIRLFYRIASVGNSDELEQRLFRMFCAALVLILFPPYLSLCQFSFGVYEEASAYAYLAGIALLVGTLAFTRKPDFRGYALLCLGAGLAPFVRPTLLFYGVASLLVAGICAWRLGWQRWKVACGLGLFCLGGGLLFFTNHIRFGSGFEFGHSLNLNSIDAMRYASRFDHPFRTEPVANATKELVSLLSVSGGNLNGYDFYRQDFFAGQSETHRWREFYFTTYDASYLVLAVGGWSLLLLPLWRRRNAKRLNAKSGMRNAEYGTSFDARALKDEVDTQERQGEHKQAASDHRAPVSDASLQRMPDALEGRRQVASGDGLVARSTHSPIRTPHSPFRTPLLVWSLVSFGCLFVFYLRFPFLTSRYLVDFAPAFAAAILALVFFINEKLVQRFPNKPMVSYALCMALVVWWGYEVFNQKGVASPAQTLTYGEVTARMDLMKPDLSAQEPLPDSYEIGMDMSVYNIRFNGAGWEADTGKTKAAITLFMNDPEYIELDVAPREGVEVSAGDYECIQAKVGLEFLKLERMEETAEGMRLLFAGPNRKIYQSGLQVAFIGFVTPEELSDGYSRFRLLRVQWRDADEDVLVEPRNEHGFNTDDEKNG